MAPNDLPISLRNPLFLNAGWLLHRTNRISQKWWKIMLQKKKNVTSILNTYPSLQPSVRDTRCLAVSYPKERPLWQETAVSSQQELYACQQPCEWNWEQISPTPQWSPEVIAATADILIATSWDALSPVCPVQLCLESWFTETMV